MLTKQKRAAIAYRIKDIDVFNDRTFYTAITGKRVPEETSYRQDLGTIAQVILDLCDTSNMIELPLDKDDKVIHVGDVVYDNTGMEWEVREFRFPFDGACIYARTDNDYSTFRPDELTHKATTIEENIEEFNKAVKVTTQYVEASMNKCVEAMKKIAEVFNRVVDSDD